MNLKCLVPQCRMRSVRHLPVLATVTCRSTTVLNWGGLSGLFVYISWLTVSKYVVAFVNGTVVCVCWNYGRYCAGKSNCVSAGSNDCAVADVCEYSAVFGVSVVLSVYDAYDA